MAPKIAHIPQHPHDPIYVKMRKYALQLCGQGLQAVESRERLEERFGISPSLASIYKWRKEFRGGLGERQAIMESSHEHDDEDDEDEDDEEEEEGDEAQEQDKNGLDGDGQQQGEEADGPKPVKMRKLASNKYCKACNREMSSRNYYEYHMLNVHEVLLGDSKSNTKFLERMSPARRKQLVFRCDACFGGELDFDGIGELEQHKRMEHGHKMHMPDWSWRPRGKTTSPPKQLPVKKTHFSAAGRRPGPQPAPQPNPKFYASAKRMLIRRDKSMPLKLESNSPLRRSTRVPKPTSPMLNSMWLAKELNELSSSEVKDEMPDSEGEEEEERSEHEVDGRRKRFYWNSPRGPTPSPRKRRRSATVHINSGSSSNNWERGCSVRFGTSMGQSSSGTTGNGTAGGGGGGGGAGSGSAAISTAGNGSEQRRDSAASAPGTGSGNQHHQQHQQQQQVAEAEQHQQQDEEQEPFVTILKDGRLEVEKPDSQQQAQPRPAEAGKLRMMSPAALDAADSMLKLALAASTPVQDKEKNLSTSAASASATATAGGPSQLPQPLLNTSGEAAAPRPPSAADSAQQQLSSARATLTARLNAASGASQQQLSSTAGKSGGSGADANQPTTKAAVVPPNGPVIKTVTNQQNNNVNGVGTSVAAAAAAGDGNGKSNGGGGETAAGQNANANAGTTNNGNNNKMAEEGNAADGAVPPQLTMNKVPPDAARPTAAAEPMTWKERLERIRGFPSLLRGQTPSAAEKQQQAPNAVNKPKLVKKGGRKKRRYTFHNRIPAKKVAELGEESGEGSHHQQQLYNNNNNKQTGQQQQKPAPTSVVLIRPQLQQQQQNGDGFGLQQQQFQQKARVPTPPINTNKNMAINNNSTFSVTPNADHRHVPTPPSGDVNIVGGAVAAAVNATTPTNNMNIMPPPTVPSTPNASFQQPNLNNSSNNNNNTSSTMQQQGGGGGQGGLQVDSIWFGNSIAAQIDPMPSQAKELVKLRIQQAIYEVKSQLPLIVVAAGTPSHQQQQHNQQANGPQQQQPAMMANGSMNGSMMDAGGNWAGQQQSGH